jgi:hypothetical protein
MTQSMTETVLDRDQELILAVYSMYTHESNHTYLQYTAACALFYYLTQKQFFDYDLDELLVYDYGEQRRYIWEAKKFMSDINILRDEDLLIRARSRSKTYRDINAHQCSDKGHEYIAEKRQSSQEISQLYEQLRKTLSNPQGEMYDVRLKDAGPMLVHERGGEHYVSRIPIQGFLKDLCPSVSSDDKGKENCIDESYEPFFI